MEAKEKAKVLDYMLNHARTLLDGKVKDIDNYSAENIILAKYDANQFIKAFEIAKKEVSLNSSHD